MELATGLCRCPYRTITENAGLAVIRKITESYKKEKEVEYKEIIKELKKGTSVRRTAKLCDVSDSTVQRIKARFNL